MLDSIAAPSPTSNVQKAAPSANSVRLPAAPDAITPAKSTAFLYTPTKPSLLPREFPSKSEKFYMWRLLKFVDQADTLEKDLMQLSMKEQEDLVKKLSQLAKEELEKAHLAQEAGRSISNWSYLNNIASCLFAGATMAIGLYLTGNPDVSGWVSYGMVAAGAGSVAAMALSEMDIWPNLMRIMGLGASMLGLVLGGGPSFAFVAAQLPDLMVRITLLGINCIFGMSTIGRSYRKSQLLWHTHEQSNARQSRRVIEGKTMENAQNVEFMIDRIEYLNERAVRMLEEQDKQIRQIQKVAASAA